MSVSFDVGNVVINAYPQDWIRTLGSRIVRIHLKDFTIDRKSQTFAFKNLGRGYRLARGAACARRDRLFGLCHDRDRRRPRLSEGCLGTGRSLHRGREAGARSAPSAATGKKLAEVGRRRRLQLDSPAVVRVPECQAPGVQRVARKAIGRRSSGPTMPLLADERVTPQARLDPHLVPRPVCRRTSSSEARPNVSRTR